MRRHKLRNKGFTERARVLVRCFKVHIEEVTPQAIPEGHAAIRMLNTLNLHSNPLGKPVAMLGNKQDSGSGQKLKGFRIAQLRRNGKRAKQGVISQPVAGIENVYAA